MKKPTRHNATSIITIFAVFSAALTAATRYAYGDTPGAADTSLADSLGAGYSLLGTIKPRHAREIRSSNWSVGAETMDRDYTVYANWKQYLGPLGVKKARIQSGWAKTEKVRGKYDWSWLDEIVHDMVEQGVEPWVCLCYGNPVYPGGGDIGLGGGMPASEEALLAWERYVVAIVARYREHVDEWEVWNEPGLRGANAAEHYATFLMRTAEAIRSQQPDARIIAFAMAGIKLSWVKDVLQRVAAADKLHLINEITYHPYKYNPSESYPAVAELRKLVASFSDKITIRQGENGAPSQRGSFGALSDYDWTEVRQAKWALRRLLGDLGHDIPSSYFSICDMQYPQRRNYKGLLAIDDDKRVAHTKLGYHAIQHLTAIFDDSFQRVRECDSIVEGNSAKCSLFVYRNDAGRPVVTVWRCSDRPGMRTEFEKLKLRLPGICFQHPVWVDLVSGQVFEMNASLWGCEDNTTSFRAAAIYDSPVVIADRGAIADVLQLVSDPSGEETP